MRPNAADEDVVKSPGRVIVAKDQAILDKALEGKDYAVGHFFIADAALMYVEFWSMRGGMTLPLNYAAHLQRMLARPSTQPPYNRKA